MSRGADFCRGINGDADEAGDKVIPVRRIITRGTSGESYFTAVASISTMSSGKASRVTPSNVMVG
jgi:hypothetical protein